MERIQFIRGLTGGGILCFTGPILAGEMPKEGPLDKALVEEFVGICHKDMEKARTLLEAHPTLLNAAHDWEKGDFETGLGAASHVGYKELASYLLSKGAQANIFTACLFGHLSIVEAMLKAFPDVLYARGPHGFSLLHHAQQGGEVALPVAEYLLSLGAKETKYTLY